MKTYKIAVIGGDGIGPEVTAEAVKVLKALSAVGGFGIEFFHYDFGVERYLKTGEIFPQKEFDFIRDNANAVLLGAIGDPRVEPGILEFGIVGKLRFELDLYANLRPIKIYSERLCPLKNRKPGDIDILVVRENTEDSYRGKYRVENPGAPDETHIQEMFYTKKGTERVIRYAFEAARARRKKRLTLVDKRNAIKAHEIYRRTFEEVSSEYPDVEKDYAYIDAFCMWLLKRAEYYDTVVTTNMFGDIATDLGASIQGGMGIAAGANLHPGRVSMFEPIHGSAPKYKGLKKASPVACVLAAGLMMDYLGEKKCLDVIETAVRDLFADEKLDAATTDSAIPTDRQGDIICETVSKLY